MVQLTKFKLPKLSHRRFINFLMLARIEGYLLVILAIFMLLPCFVSMLYETESSVPFLIAVGITAGAGLGMCFLKPKNKDMGRREAILLTGLTWVVLSLFGMLPFILYGTHMSVTDAFFETMSAFTTTGVSILSTLDGVPKSILLWRCLMQWFGGLGILLFTLAVVPMLNSAGGLLLFNAEVTGITHDKLRPRVSNTAKGLWGMYIALTALLIILLSFSRMDFFDAICYGLSTMSTGGFATTDQGIVEFASNYVKMVLTIFMFLGGINFVLLFHALQGNVRNLFRNSVFKLYCWLVVFGYVALAIDSVMQGLYHNAEDLTVNPLFQCVSVISTTGISTPGFKNGGPLAIMVLFLFMSMGACSGSTSGGAKIDRFLVMIKFLKNEFYKIMHPSAVTTVILNGKGTTPGMIYKTLAFLIMYVLVVVMSGAIVSLTGVPLGEAVFRSLESISNSGICDVPGGLSGSYAHLPALGKWVYAFVMLTGRLEIFTVLLVFTPGFWHR